MAACGSLQHIFEKPLPEPPTLLEPFSPWKQIKSMKPLDDSSFTEIFGDLHFKEKPTSFLSSSSSSPPSYVGSHKSSDSFSSMNLESLQLCTEGLGFESSDDVEELKSDIDKDWRIQEEKPSNISKQVMHENLYMSENRRSRTNGREFPPPISSIGKSGKPCVCFKSYRYNGRFVLNEVRIPMHEFLHAYREDGRLRLHLVHSDDNILEKGEEEEEEEGKGNDEECVDCRYDNDDERNGVENVNIEGMEVKIDKNEA